MFWILLKFLIFGVMLFLLRRERILKYVSFLLVNVYRLGWKERIICCKEIKCIGKKYLNWNC